MMVALLYFLICASAVTLALIAVTSGSAARRKIDRARQAQFAMRSAAELLRDDLTSGTVSGQNGLTLTVSEELTRYGCANMLPPEGFRFLSKDCEHSAPWQAEGPELYGVPGDAVLAGPLRRGTEAMAARLSRLDRFTGQMNDRPVGGGPDVYRETFAVEIPGDPRFSGENAVTAEFSMELTGERAGDWEVVFSAPNTGAKIVLHAEGVLSDGETVTLPGPVCTLRFAKGEPNSENYEEQERQELSAESSHTFTLFWAWDRMTIDRERQS